MTNVLIFVKNDKELELAKARLFGKTLLEHTLAELRKLDVDNIYLIGGLNADSENVIRRRDVKEVISDLSDSDGKCLLISPFYPFITAEDYRTLLMCQSRAAVMVAGDSMAEAFVIPENMLDSFEELNYAAVEIEESHAEKVNCLEDVPVFVKKMKMMINNSLIRRGVTIIDPENTYISPETIIDKDVTVYPNVVIEGHSFIGRGSVVTSGSHLLNVRIGEYCQVISSRLSGSTMGNRNEIGPNAHVHNDSVVADKVSIGDNVEVRNSRIGKNTKISHMAYLSNTTVGENAIIGCGVSVVDFDGAHKHSTLIGDFAVIGSNACLIAPLRVGDYGVVAAGSTVDADVKDGEMAIARLYQTNKSGYGYKYIKK